jgi:hypothetical protein
MANVVQWTVSAFYAELKKLDAAGRAEIAALASQKALLQAEYTKARNAGNQVGMTFLQPLIHKNSELRLRARDYVAKFNELVGSVSALLRNAGLSVPATLSGLGVAPLAIIIPAAAVASLGIIWGIVYTMQSGRAAITKVLSSQGPALLRIAADPASTPEQKAAALAAYKKLLEDAGLPPPGADWLKDLTPILGLVALILLAPSLLRLLPAKGTPA